MIKKDKNILKQLKYHMQHNQLTNISKHFILNLLQMHGIKLMEEIISHSKDFICLFNQKYGKIFLDHLY
jgi:hypothetical protein